MKVELAQLAGRDNDTAYNLERALGRLPPVLPTPK